MKKENENKINSSKYRKASEYAIGDIVLMRNHKRKVKFDPKFIVNPFEVVDIDPKSGVLLLHACNSDAQYHRHSDDVKPWSGIIPQIEDTGASTENVDLEGIEVDDGEKDSYLETDNQVVLRRGERQRMPNSRYKDYGN